MSKYGYHKTGQTPVHPTECAVTGFHLRFGYQRIMLPGLDGVCVGVMPGHTLGPRALARLVAEMSRHQQPAALKPQDIPVEARVSKTPSRKRGAKKDA